VSTVQKIQDEHKITEVLDVINLPSSTYYDHQNGRVTDEDKYGEIIDKLPDIIRKNPGYGARKIQRELREDHDLEISRGVLLRLLKRENLNIERNIRNTSKSGYRKGIEEAGEHANLLARLERVELFDAACTDFTEIKYRSAERKAMFIGILGHESKMIYGWSLGETRGTELALEAWESSRKRLNQLGVNWEGMIIHHDRDAVFTGDEWVDQVFLEDGLRPSYSMDGAKQNHVIESFNGHFKGEAESLFCVARTMEELEERVRDRVEYWNHERRHASLDYVSPQRFVDQNLDREEEKK